MKKVVNLLIIALTALSVVFTSCEVSSSGGGSTSLEANIMDGYPKYSSEKNQVYLYIQSNYTNDEENVKFKSFSYGLSEENNDENIIATSDIKSSWNSLKKAYRIDIDAPTVNKDTDYYYAFAVSRGSDVVGLFFKITVKTAQYVLAQTPEITTQPEGATYELGIDLPKALKVEAMVSDGGTLSYQWYKDGSLITGATDSSYIPTSDVESSNLYYVSVKNTNNSEVATKISNSVTIEFVKTDAAKPTITTDINDIIYKLTDSVTSFALSVIASVSDGGVITYQWYKDDDIITDQTTSSCTASSVGKYYCVITNTNDKVGGTQTATVKSRLVFVTDDTYADTPIFTTQPVSQENLSSVNDIQALNVVVASVTDGGTLSYQWYKDDVSISGATSSSYKPTGDGTYYVIVTNTFSGKTSATSQSNNAVISIKVVNAETPTIKTQPQSASYSSISNAIELKIEATVSDGGTLSYQWKKDSVAISGATSSSYKPAEFGSYSCTVTNTNNNINGTKTVSVTSNTALISESTEVEIVFDNNLPTTSCTLGTKLTIAVTVTPTGTTPTYQWYSTDGNSASDTEIVDATSTSYTPTEVGRYYCRVTATKGTANKVADSNTVEVVLGSGSGNVGFDFN